MKKINYKTIIVFSIIILLLIVLIFVLKDKFISTDNILLKVMNNEQEFIDENGNKYLFYDYKVYGVDPGFAETYTFVDLDKDGKNELAVLTTSTAGAYMIFRYDNTNNRVYGYHLGIRSFMDLKTDGTFVGSGGAGIHSYNKLEFNTNNATIIELAYSDVMEKKYKINNISTSEEDVKSFISEFNKKENCIWIKDKIKPKKTEDSNNNTENPNVTNSSVTNTSTQNETQLKPINLNDYINVEFKGLNLTGYASVTLDKEQIMLDHKNDVSFKMENFSVYQDLYGKTDKSSIHYALKCISAMAKPSSNLSNGDKIEIIWSVNEEKLKNYFNCNFIYSTIQMEVSGLEDANTYDPFENLEVSYSGIAPLGKASTSSDDIYGGYYTITPNESLKNGDIITITYKCLEKNSMISRYGKYPSIFEKQYTVSGLNTYPDSIDDFSSETLNAIDLKVKNWTDNKSSNYFNTKYTASIAGYAFLMPIAGDEPRFFAIYKIKNETNNVIEEFYQTFYYESDLKFENGKVSFSVYDAYPQYKANTKQEITDNINAHVGDRFIVRFESYK